MAIKLYNIFNDRKEKFSPKKEKNVSMYVCGVTPYADVHLGHARTYLVFDIIKRHLLRRGYKVTHVQNFTDVDDKIIKMSQMKNINPSKLAQFYINDYFTQVDKLNILRADKYPRVTQSIPEIINFVRILLDRGFAYEIDGNVYFSVGKSEDYGKMSRRNLKNLKCLPRVVSCNDKKSTLDFVLWKRAKKDDPAEVIWESPWGKGRPGWHIECSVMSSMFLGDTIDIHGGGNDLIFPHHENEIAQSEAMTGKQFVKYWIHSGFVTIGKEKMSKTLNNFLSLEAVFRKHSPRTVRYYLLTQHYSTPLCFSDLALETAKSALQGIDEAYARLVSLVKNSTADIIDEDLLELQDKFLMALDDDFNSERAISYLHKVKNVVLKEIFNGDKERLLQLRKLFESLAEVSLGIILHTRQNVDENLRVLLRERSEARKNGNWTESDRLRNLIAERGYKLVDNKDGSSVLLKKI
ncbi:MAG: cysteine--tRNA ligase [Endomicrobium sp.]|jgi:cysteinyl-tRNA synthetase|nr:cysteine--tRNA ligase [Endomicrobium sp.]